jgi:hypothetical protein
MLKGYALRLNLVHNFGAIYATPPTVTDLSAQMSDWGYNL